MLRITVSRIRIFIAVLGWGILSASLFDWAQNLRAAKSGYTWVKAAAPIASAAETAEIWQISASCRAPVFRQCGAAIETAARQSLRSGSGCRSRLGHSPARRRPPAGYGSKRRPLPPRQRRASGTARKIPRKANAVRCCMCDMPNGMPTSSSSRLRNTSGNDDWRALPIKA